MIVININRDVPPAQAKKQTPPMVHITLTVEQAETVQTALIHTRRDRLNTKDRQVVHDLLQELAACEQPMSPETQRHRIRQYISAGFR